MLKAADSRRLALIRRLCSSADEMHTAEAARLVTELATAPRVTKSAAIGIKRLSRIAAMKRTRRKP